MGTKNTMYLLIVGFAIFNCFQFSCCKVLDPVHQWRYIDFNWKSEAEASEALTSGLYNPSVVAPYDVDVHYSQRAGRRIFVALEGRPGVPATLATVSAMTVGSGPLLDPYPDWSWFNNNCSSLISIYRVAIDECDRLWVLDTGNNTCPGKLVVFDLNTDRLMRVISLPTNISGNKDGLSMLTTPIVETSGPKCQNTAVYISDSAGDGLIIYNNGFLARLEHPTFKHDRRDEVFETGPYSINFTAGLLGMSISPRLFPNEPRFLYYRPLVSRGLYAVNSRQIRNFRPGNYLAISGTDRVLSSPGVAQAFSAEGTLFMGLTKELSIICWNRYRTLTTNNIVTIDQDSQTLNYANGIKVIKGPNGEENLWVLSNRFVGFLQGELNFNDDYNFFILTKPVKDLVRGTRCELPAELQAYLRQTANRTQQQTSK